MTEPTMMFIPFLFMKNCRYAGYEPEILLFTPKPFGIFSSINSTYKVLVFAKRVS